MAEDPQGAAPAESPEQDQAETKDPAELAKDLGQFLEAVGQDQSVPDDAKKAFAVAQAAFQKGLEILSSGGDQQSTTTPEQGGNPNAVPMSMGRPG